MGDVTEVGKVVALDRGRDQSADRTIELLEAALELARSTPCHGVSIFLMSRDGDNHFFDGTDSRTLLIGSLAQMMNTAMEN